MRSASLVVLFAAAASAATAQPASAAFVPSTPVGAPSTTTGQPLVAASADGSASVAYTQAGDVFVATKQPGQAFASPVDLGAGTAPKLASSASGRSILAWTDGASTRYALRDAGSATFAVQPALAGSAGDAAVAVADDGRAYLAQVLPTETDLLTIAPGNTTVQPATSLATAAAASSAAIAIQSPTGTAWVAASAKSSGTSTTRVRSWSVATGQGSPRMVATDVDTSSGTPPLGSSTSYGAKNLVGASGSRPSFFWTRTIGAFGFPTQTTTLAVERADEPFTSTPTQLDAVTTSITSPSLSSVSISSDASGAATALWFGSTSLFSAHASGAFRGADGTWGASVSLDTPSSGTSTDQYSSIAAAPTGGGGTQAVAGVGPRIFVTTLSTTGAALSVPTVLDDQSQADPAGVGAVAAAGTGSGDTVAAWLRLTGSAGAAQVQTALGDATAPSLTVGPGPAPSFPPPTTQASVDGVNALLRQPTFVATASDTWTGTSPITWSFDDGGTATGATVSHTFATAGAHVATASVRDLAGNVATKSYPFTISQVSLTPPPAVGIATLSKAAFSSKRFAVVKGKAAKKGQGSTITWVLSVAAKVELSVSKSTSGYRSGTACVAKKPKGAKGKVKRCTFWKALGLAGAPQGVAGTNRFAFNGKVAGKTLAPGKYRLALAPVAPLQTHGTTAATLDFTITK
ncbi:MAG: PKD domain-containing protein [Patulibacter sp.]|nr:PKD domain-containing protein [Patulibacter sp.]